jgi:Flp pilus assembly pilin Flp
MSRRHDEGATGVEYGLLVGLVALVLIVGAVAVGRSLSGGLGGAVDALTGQEPDPESATTPEISRYGPDSGTTMGGQVVDIYGGDLQAGAWVRFGSVTATVLNVETRWNGESHLTVVTPATSPAGRAGPVNLTVQNPDGRMATAGVQYRYLGPGLSTVSPSTGPLAGGGTVTVTGYRIGPAPTITFGSRQATIVSQSTDLNTLQVVVPPGSAATSVQVRVTNADGLSGARSYTYTM